MVNRTRVEGGGYSKHDILTQYDWRAGCNNIVDVLLFERSEFLIAPCKKKKTDRLCVCGCSANLGFGVYVRMFLGFSVEKLSWF